MPRLRTRHRDTSPDGGGRHFRLGHNASAPLAGRRAPDLDEQRASAGARRAPASLRIRGNPIERPSLLRPSRGGDRRLVGRPGAAADSEAEPRRLVDGERPERTPSRHGRPTGRPRRPAKSWCVFVAVHSRQSRGTGSRLATRAWIDKQERRGRARPAATAIPLGGANRWAPLCFPGHRSSSSRSSSRTASTGRGPGRLAALVVTAHVVRGSRHFIV